ncbi:putative receptor protein kinase ZmPK1 [Camellia lanceoleosa]|uniref:Receptor protein kinase ZmPK1 n=1 Tax=Camellia lanceoleosa TaxID=1840588 RepID=A0ACC0FNZ4_9ERIC|nr:putative receptor protein kinase ZmPK1 [Camellia lanceoleosa]
MKTCLDSCDCKGFRHRFNQSSGVYDCNPKWVLRNGHWSPSLAEDLFVKVPQTPLNKDFLNKLDCSGTANMVQQLDRVYERRHENGLLTFLVWFAAAVGCVEVITICLVWCFLNRNGTHLDMGGGYIPAATGFKRFTYNELKQATRGFRDEVGRGAGEMEQRRLIKWAREKVSTGAAMESWIEEIVDPVISGKYDVPKMQILVAVALKCVEEDKDARPSMTQVLEMLQYHESN